MTSRCIFLMPQPSSMNRTASQSSNCGCVGGSARVPKSLGVRTIPSPKWCCQLRFTITRAVSGLSRLAMSVAISRRAAVLEGFAIRTGEDFQPLPRDFLAADSRVAALEDAGVGLLLAVHQD